MENLSTAVRYFKVKPLLWEERVASAYCESDRMQALLEYPDFYARVAKLCIPWLTDEPLLKRESLGRSLTEVCLKGQSKRELSQSTGLTPIQSQQIMNHFYGVFYMYKNWQKSMTPKIAWESIHAVVYGQTKLALDRTLKTLPKDWTYEGILTFKVPSYGYEVEVEKYFRHHFEREIEIRDTIVKLPVEILF